MFEALAARANKSELHNGESMEIINKFCPRSGKPVSKDSLTKYRGYVVGFCNPGCSSDFAKNTQGSPNDTRYFDILIKEKFNE